APAEVADAYGISAGVELVVRRHLVRTQDAVVEVGASWLKPTDTAGTPPGRVGGLRRPPLPEGEGGARGGRRAAARPSTPPAAPPRGGRTAGHPAGHAGAAPAAHRLRRAAPADRGGHRDLARPDDRADRGLPDPGAAPEAAPRRSGDRPRLAPTTIAAAV